MSQSDTADTSARPLIHSPLEGEHEALGGRLVPFSGWSMPVRYPEGTIAEHLAVRDSVGVFDVSHLGSVRVKGPGSFDAIDGLFTNDLSRINPGRAQYTLLLNQTGGVVDDVIVWWLAPDDFWVIPNAANTDDVVSALDAAAADFGVSVEDESQTFAIIAVQGPKWAETLAAAGLERLVVDRFRVAADAGIVSAGTGYTGERGCELLVSNSDAVRVWQSLISAARDLGGGPAGLGARDTLRLEMGYPLHGNEMDATVSPFEAGLGWVVDLSKSRFRGKAAIEAGPESAQRELVGFEMTGREIPRAHCSLLRSGNQIGEATSGNHSPVLGMGIGMARVTRGLVEAGDEIEIDIRGRRAAGVVADLPFLER